MSIKLKSASLSAAQTLRSFLDERNAVISACEGGITCYVYHAYAPGFSANDCVVAPDKLEDVAYLEPVNYTYPWRLERLTYLTEDWAFLATLLDNPSKATIPLIVVG